jgi:hypothetical protein
MPSFAVGPEEGLALGVEVLLLMIKFYDYPIFYFGLSGFGSFQNRNRDGAKVEDLKFKVF